ncbi:citrate lyase acyl carrier protein [Lacticaseibacillus baoqingensis]|uniref:Citrate lyase acyl carrier protein n=1 Tax=Lacticaseibacillus baoqingensis TaxID=2486013 RepID=A0ABW4EAT2_9LACO|nr:citrate lyase acyl carrier protein [Lacticaseibacillus baoqingensis]
MAITTSALAGTLESSDAQVLIEPRAQGVQINLESSVYAQYGAHIEQLAHELVETLGITNATISITDKGALDCTLKARIEAAYYRALGKQQDFDWEVL